MKFNLSVVLKLFSKCGYVKIHPYGSKLYEFDHLSIFGKRDKTYGCMQACIQIFYLFFK